MRHFLPVMLILKYDMDVTADSLDDRLEKEVRVYSRVA